MFGGLEPLLTPIDPLAKLTNRQIPHIRKDVLHILIYQSKKKIKPVFHLEKWH
jgi:hypothetical protein